jgi:ClpP class serine protease
MPNWKDLIDEARDLGSAIGSPFDVLRRKYLRRYGHLVRRNVITYYSGWLQKPELERHGVPFGLNDADKGAFMAVMHRMDKAKGLDLFLHTPGGDLGATESLVDYLRKVFGTDVRAVIPQVALSTGTMLALSCKEVLMGKHSTIGPIDPQVGPHLSAHGVLEEFETARQQVKADPGTAPVWQAILSNYRPALVGECMKARQWAMTLVHGWLVSGMFAGRPDADAAATKVVEFLADHALAVSQARHVSAERAKGIGVSVTLLEEPGRDKLQDAVLGVHHTCLQTLTFTGAYKLVENQAGVSVIATAPRGVVQPAPPQTLPASPGFALPQPPAAPDNIAA